MYIHNFWIEPIQIYLAQFIYIYMHVFLEAQVASANLHRSYRRAPRGAGEADNNVEGAGICHLCSAGRGVDWEDLQLSFAKQICLYTIP